MVKDKKSPEDIQLKNETSLDNVFFSTFVGENVEMICKGVNDVSANGIAFVIQGILLDIDEVYYYLSDDGNSIARAIKKSEVSFIEIAKSNNEYQRLLESFEVNGKKENAN